MALPIIPYASDLSILYTVYRILVAVLCLYMTYTYRTAPTSDAGRGAGGRRTSLKGAACARARIIGVKAHFVDFGQF